MGKMKTRFEIISDAREILELPESATLQQIKKNYKHLIKKWHPDKNLSNQRIAEDKTKKIIQAYKVIAQYCDDYKFSFTRQEVEKYLSDQEKWFKQFGKDPIWANQNK
jgi:DnaJ-class molecular chaperone